MLFKKSLLFSCSLLLLALVLSACGTSSGNPPVASGTPQGQTDGNSGETSGTRTYESAKGSIQVPAHPQRVVVANQDYVGDVLALGVKPVGAAGWVFDTPYYQEQLKGVEKVGDLTSISFEKIASLDPDLIITYQEDAYDQLSKIAPTVFIPFGKYNYKDRLTEIGKVVNREKEAEQWIASFHQKAAEKKSQLADLINQGKKVAIVEITAKDLFLYGKSYGRGGEIIYNELGLHAPAKVEEVAFKEGWAKMSLETLPEYVGGADYIFLGVREAAIGGADGQARKAEIVSSKLWKDLPAVKSGHVYEYNQQSFYFTDPVALDHQLDEITDFLSSKK